MEEIKALQVWLRGRVPVEAVMPSEKLVFSNTGEVVHLNSIQPHAF